jgi:hypothetical protein
MAMGGMGLRAQGMDGRKKGSGPPPTPAEVTSAAYWLDSTRGVVGTSPVTSWTDRKLAKAFTNGGSPQLVAGTPPRISFAGSPDYLAATNMSAVDYSGLNPAAMTFAFRTQSSFNNAAILAFGGSGNHFSLGINASGILKASRSSNWATDDAVDILALSTNTLYVATAYYNGSRLILRKNSVEVANVSNTYSFGVSNLARVAGLTDNFNFALVDAMQAVFFTSAATIADIIAVENYFRSQIGI